MPEVEDVQRRQLPPSSIATICPKCRSTSATPLFLSDAILSSGAPWAFVNHRWPGRDDSPYALIDWPAQWLGWTCRCGFRWETRCADDD